jgi:hypothetical protein
MKPNKSIKNILIFLLGLAAGFSFCHLFHQRSNPVLPQHKDMVVVPAEQAKKIAATEKKVNQQKAAIETENRVLSNALIQTKAALERAKKNNARLQTQLYHAFEYPVYPEHNTDTLGDYTISNEPVKNQLDTLFGAAAVKDSLQEVIALNLETQLRNKDSTIALQSGQYQLLKNSFDQSTGQQEVLLSLNKSLQKNLKRQRFSSKVKSAAILVLSGLALKQFL